MRAIIARLMIIVAACAALSSCVVQDKVIELVKGPSCYGGEEAVVGKCNDDKVPSGNYSDWWQPVNVNVNGKQVMYSVTGIPGAVFLPSEPKGVLDKQYPHHGIKNVVRYSNIDIVHIWVAETCKPDFFVGDLESYITVCGAIFLEDSDFEQITPELAKQLLSVETVTQLERRASSAKRDIVFTLGVVKNK